MRHSVYGKHLGRDKNQRRALLRSLVRSLVLHGSIQTTEAKTKAIKGLVDKLITLSRKNTPAAISTLERFINQKEISERFSKEIVPGLKDRNSGFTSLVRLGRRTGDGAMMVKMSLINANGEQPTPLGETVIDSRQPKTEVKDEKRQTKRVRRSTK